MINEILPVLRQSDEHAKVLTTPCTEVVDFDDVRYLVADMWNSIYAYRGVGLAATQIGSSLRVAVVDTLQTSTSNRKLVLINPVIVGMDGEHTTTEGCLSLPGLEWLVTRAWTVSIRFRDLEGGAVVMKAKGLLARAIQHEVDHLNGVLCNSHALPGSERKTGR